MCEEIGHDFIGQMSEKLGIEKWKLWKDDNGRVKYIVGFQDKEPSAINETKKFLTRLWNRRKDVGNQKVVHAYHLYGLALYQVWELSMGLP